MLNVVIICCAAQQQSSAQRDQEMARLKAILSQIADSLSKGRLAEASRSATALGTRISQHEMDLALEELEHRLPADGAGRIYPLDQAAKAAYRAGQYSKAEIYARELLSLSDKYPEDPYRGSAIYAGHVVLGRIALNRDHNVEEAKAQLMAASKTPGSPVLNSFGPNVALARDLLMIGERDVVLQFFESCRAFWKGAPAQQKLESWTETLKSCCQMPDFGFNLTN